MTSGSDLDLVFVYDAPAGIDARRQAAFARQRLFRRLAQRLIAALTVLTAEGVFRRSRYAAAPVRQQRPGRGRLETFARLSRGRTWTWERMALTRARVIAGPPQLAAKLDAVDHTERCAAASIGPSCPADVGEMREKSLPNIRQKSLGSEIHAGRLDRHRVPRPDAAIAPCLRRTFGAPPNTVAALKRSAEAGCWAQADADTLIAAAIWNTRSPRRCALRWTAGWMRQMRHPG